MVDMLGSLLPVLGTSRDTLALPMAHYLLPQVASAAGRDLLYREVKPLQPVGMVFRLDIARQHRDAIAPRQDFESALRKGGFAGAGRTDEVQALNAVLLKSATQLRRDAVVLTEDFSLQRHSVHILPPPGRPTPTRLH